MYTYADISSACALNMDAQLDHIDSHSTLTLSLFLHTTKIYLQYACTFTEYPYAGYTHNRDILEIGRAHV